MDLSQVHFLFKGVNFEDMDEISLIAKLKIFRITKVGYLAV
jgi:hypothetical protein